MSRLHRLACVLSDLVTRFNRHPVVVVAFPVMCAAVVLLGWTADALHLALLGLTTALSVDASWSARLILLKQGQDAGEVE